MVVPSSNAALEHSQATEKLRVKTSANTKFAPHRCNLAIPRRGHVLTAVSEEYGRPVRAAVSTLSDALREENCAEIYRTIFSRRTSEPGAPMDRSPAEMLAWTLVSVWLCGFVGGRVLAGSGLETGVAWFFSGMSDRNPIRFVPRLPLAKVDLALANCCDQAGYRDLLPYVLDPYGPGSRLSIRRNAATEKSRDQKRTHGVYYTPADLAAYMVDECLGKFDGRGCPPTVLDPACGTGVFLRAVLEVLKAAFPHQSTIDLAATYIYGTDVDPWALNAATFLLLADCLTDGGEMTVSPLLLWHRLRLNLACVDALRLDPASLEDEARKDGEIEVSGELANGRLPYPCGKSRFSERVRLSQLFDGLPQSDLVILGNPPYSRLGFHKDLLMLERSFVTLHGNAKPNSEIYPLFIEQMVRLARLGQAAGAFVLPLSLANGVGKQLLETRSLIEKTPGKWRFAFFDREPQALFGEDVKTRNSVVFWHREDQEQKTKIESGPLRKWRGERRAAMFKTIKFTPIDCPIRAGIPKVEGASQSRAYEVLERRWHRFEHACLNFRRVPLAGALKNGGHTVFTGATAYNFLNVFLNPPPEILENTTNLTEHPLHAMEFSNREDTAAAFALLSSHIVYWWWRVTQDGFHLNSRFLTSLPFGTDALYGDCGPRLAECGERLWALIRTNPIISCNRGRTSLAYSANGFEKERLEIDRILAVHAGLESKFVAEIQHFTTHTITAELFPVSRVLIV